MNHARRAIAAIAAVLMLAMVLGALGALYLATISGEVTIKPAGHAPAWAYRWNEQPVWFIFGLGMWVTVGLAFAWYLRGVVRFVVTGKKVSEP